MKNKFSLAAGALAVAAALTAGLITVSARATGPGLRSAGEASPLLVCFYECKRNFDFNVDDDDDDHDNGNRRPGDGYWKEVTLLVLANQANGTIGGEWSLFDGNQSADTPYEPDAPIYAETFNLSEQDLEEINVCRRADLNTGPLPVPEAGTIFIYLDTIGGQQLFPVTGVYGWVKNVLGEINRFIEDPFNSPVRDVAKTECRLVPAVL
jgi:hypothetical protein